MALAWHQARFPSLTQGYESFYLRAVDPERPRSVWLRHTVHRAGRTLGSIWLTLFDGEAGGPVAAKWTFPDPEPHDDGISVGESRFGTDGVSGRANGAEWTLRWEGGDEPVVHLPRPWMYRAPLPRTKAVSPRAGTRLSGKVTLGATSFDLDGWPGMVGHNWGAEHAERWIWLHGIAFPEAPEAWLDIVLGRVRLGGATTPWIANGIVHAGGVRHRVGGIGRARSTRVVEDPLRLDLELRGSGLRLEATAHARRRDVVVWRYADPDGREHHVSNCSIAALDLVVVPDGGVPLHVSTAHGAAYELGMRETTHGLPVQPYADPS